MRAQPFSGEHGFRAWQDGRVVRVHQTDKTTVDALSSLGSMHGTPAQSSQACCAAVRLDALQVSQCSMIYLCAI